MLMKLCGAFAVVFVALAIGAVAKPPQCLADGDLCNTLNTWKQCCPGLDCQRISIDSRHFRCNSPQTNISSKNSSLLLNESGK